MIQKYSQRSRSRGATLLIALIFLVLMSLFAISAFNSSSVNMRVVGNTESRQESAAAVQVAIEETISGTEFYVNPDGVAASTVPVDVTGDSVADYTVSMTPKPYCYRAVPTTLPAPTKTGSDGYEACRSAPSPPPVFVEGGPAGGASALACDDAEWNIRASVTDLATRTTVAADQGIAVTMFGYQVTDYCK
ncbi:PilX N-terminal domain-containing pilus assembly protein [Ottowia caeni]|uniref:pilus assembly PilX family protein n=1 Tax=Ottowia caeni TaxID=2870339 RepID=UPI001E2B5638|nr:pilus assembly PilX N-terminal domain-containing protein [Ottowia caeni]